MNQPAQPPAAPAPAAPVSAPPVAVAPVVARVAKIALSDYRAFPAGQTYEFNLGPEGKNLLLFGENGSGKTSLFRALVDLTSRTPGIIDFKNVRHIYSPGVSGFVSVDLTAGKPGGFRWEYGKKHPASTDGEPFALLADRCRFLDYKALLETNFVHRSGKPNLFDLLVKGVLRDLPVLVGGSTRRLGQVYDTMLRANPATYHGSRKLAAVDKACEDFNNALANHLPEVIVEGRRLIKKMGVDGLDFDLVPGKVTYNRSRIKSERKFIGQEIGLTAKLFGQPLDHPQLFLNESRLTALALAIYLGAASLVLKSPITGVDGTIKVRLLVLDDVLIGLDLSNRLPVLKVLNEDFADWQIILMTYDRVWFELAKEFTEHTGRWTTLNLRELPTAPGQPGRPNVEPCPNPLAIAIRHFLAGDLMATAVYVRAAFETKLKNVCHDHGVKVQFNSREIKTDKLWQGIVDRQGDRQKAGKPNFIDPALMNDIETIRSTVLNRMSHSGVSTLVATEVQFALETVKKLQQQQFTED